MDSSNDVEFNPDGGLRNSNASTPVLPEIIEVAFTSQADASIFSTDSVELVETATPSSAAAINAKSDKSKFSLLNF